MKVTVKINNQVYDVEIGDLDARPILATIGCDTYEIFPESSAAPMIAETVTSASTPAAPVIKPIAAVEPTANIAQTVLAPIPGVIIAIAICEGDMVAYGQELCTLEAMKMKNAIRATRAGRVSRIRVNVGDHVKHGQVLVEFAE